MALINLSPLDEARFGVRSARANEVTRQNLEEVLAFCHENSVKFLIARVRVNQLDAVQAMEQHGFLLMDTLVYYTFKLSKPIPEDIAASYIVRPMHDDESEVIKQIATESFKNYYGHYHADPRIDKSKADEVYVDWARNSAVSRQFADEVLVAAEGDETLGFATLRMNTPQQAEGVLFGVAPKAQGRGIYRSFIIRATEWARAQDALEITVSTQITNVAVQKVWARVGYEFDQAYYTFHKWFDD
jgi:GNAT superfamily N-acetyltransferase